MSRFNRRCRFGYVVNHDRMTSIPVECTIASNGSSFFNPACIRSARSNPSAISLIVTSLVSDR
jgi:hypothetical protein